MYKVEGTDVIDKMEEELERYRRVQALWRKARALARVVDNFLAHEKPNETIGGI